LKEIIKGKYYSIDAYRGEGAVWGAPFLHPENFSKNSVIKSNKNTKTDALDLFYHNPKRTWQKTSQTLLTGISTYVHP
jgi:hypothetical protein